MRAQDHIHCNYSFVSNILTLDRFHYACIMPQGRAYENLNFLTD